MSRAFLVSSLFWVTIQFSQGFPEAVFLPENLLGILFVGIGGTLIPFSLMCWGIQQVRAERGAIAATLEPVIAAVLAWLWLGQSLNFSQILGGILVIGAIALLQIHQAATRSQIG
jgi:DME family drug/metabolite transporter